MKTYHILVTATDNYPDIVILDKQPAHFSHYEYVLLRDYEMYIYPAPDVVMGAIGYTEIGRAIERKERDNK